MVGADRDDFKMRRINGKHFAFLNSVKLTAKGFKISCLSCKKQFAYCGSKMSLKSCSFHGLTAKLLEIDQFIEVNFWRLIGFKN